MVPFRGVVVSLLIAVPAFAGDVVSFERRAQLLDVLSRTTHSDLSCHKLGVISQAVPPSAVLSRLAFDGASNTWELALSKGSPADAQAILGALTKAKLCGPVSLKADGTASCTVASKRVPLAGAPPRSLEPTSEHIKIIEERLPVSAPVDLIQLQFADVASKNELRDFALQLTKTPESPAVDVVTLAMKGRTTFAGAAGVVCEGVEGQRVSRLQSFVLSSPRVKNAAWEVDMQVTIAEYRLRKDVADSFEKLTFVESEAPKIDGVTEVVRTRSPFGPVSSEPLFAGSTRVVFPDECSEPGSVTEAPQFRGDPELDDWSVVFSKVSRDESKSCVMVTDAAGHCHVLRRNSRFGRLKVGSLTPQELRFVTYDTGRDFKPVMRTIPMKVASPYAPPTWFCN